jgi:hypothetical protein
MTRDWLLAGVLMAILITLCVRYSQHVDTMVHQSYAAAGVK